MKISALLLMLILTASTIHADKPKLIVKRAMIEKGNVIFRVDENIEWEPLARKFNESWNIDNPNTTKMHYSESGRMFYYAYEVKTGTNTQFEQITVLSTLGPCQLMVVGYRFTIAYQDLGKGEIGRPGFSGQLIAKPVNSDCNLTDDDGGFVLISKNNFKSRFFTLHTKGGQNSIRLLENPEGNKRQYSFIDNTNITLLLCSKPAAYPLLRNAYVWESKDAQVRYLMMSFKKDGSCNYGCGIHQLLFEIEEKSVKVLSQNSYDGDI